MASILAVDDDSEVRGLVVRLLEGEGHVVDEASDALGAMQRVGAQRPDLILLDVVMPAVSGLDLLVRIRETIDVPVILLTGQGTEDERIQGLRLGADDYVVKPFSPGELIARVESVLRRSQRATAAASETSSSTRQPLRFGDLEIDLASREVRRGEQLVSLTAREFGLLAFLAQSPRQVFSREQLLDQVWGSSPDWQDESTVTEHVRRVRHKVEADPEHPRWIVTVRGVGYRFEP